MESREVKDALYEQFARVGKACSHPKRVELLDLLSQRQRSVDELAEMTGMTMASASAQLQVLRRSRLVTSRRSGKRVIYDIAGQSTADLVEALQETAQARLAEVGEILRDAFDAGGLLPVPQDELAKRLADPDVVVVDVRPADEYAAGHIAGAISLPIDEIVTRLSVLPANAEIIAYCRGPYCVLAPQAIEVLKRSGYGNVRRLATGLPQWRAAGLPVDSAAVSASTP